jgi:hypothetical protein
VHVEAAFTELEFDTVWIGAGNREDLTFPVLDLRESAQRTGLLRKHRGRTRGHRHTAPDGLVAAYGIRSRRTGKPAQECRRLARAALMAWPR